MNGTFRTLDVTKLTGGGGATFMLFFGAVGSFLALLGGLHCRRTPGTSGIACRQAVILVALYFLIIASPLSSIFYSRCAGFAGMGLTVLAGLAVQSLLGGRLIPSKSMVRLFAAFVISVAVGSSCLAWFVYPHFKPAIERKLMSEASQAAYAAIPSIAKMRAYQIAAFPQEVSLRNPEGALTALSVIVFAFAFSGKAKRAKRDKLLLASLCLGVVPVLLFHARYRPKHPIELWQRMLAGGDAQQQASRMATGGLRLDETDRPLSEMIFPNAMSALYRINCVAGYSALQPPSIFRYPANARPPAAEWRADLHASESGISYLSPENENKPSSRFRRSSDGKPAGVSILNETFNSITLDVPMHEMSQSLIRTDTFYPGWRAVPDVPVGKSDPVFSRIGPIPATSDGTMKLMYSPTMSRFFGPAIGLGSGCIAVMLITSFARRRKTPAAGP